MTTIIATSKNGVVVMGADSQTTEGSRKNNHSIMEKISSRNGYLIGGSGDSSACDIIQHIWVPPVPNVAQRKNLYHYMITDVTPSIRECLAENDYKSDSKDNESGFNLLIAFNGEVFNIGDFFTVILNGDGIYGVGSGSQFGIGALYSGKTVEEALVIAAQNDIYTSGPFQIITQKKSEKNRKEIHE